MTPPQEQEELLRLVEEAREAAEEHPHDLEIREVCSTAPGRLNRSVDCARRRLPHWRIALWCGRSRTLYSPLQ